MIKPLHIQIREIIEEMPGLSQKGLAECMGLNPAAINRMLHGRRNIMVDEIPVIEAYLGVTLQIGHATGVGISETAVSQRGIEYHYKVAALGGGGAAPSSGAEAPRAPAPAVPVFHADAIGNGLTSGTLVDWAMRHPSQTGIDNAFAVYVSGDDMAPRYFKGELVYLHPGRPLAAHQDALVVLQDGAVMLRRVQEETADDVTLLQINPPARQTVRRSQIKNLYVVVGRG